MATPARRRGCSIRPLMIPGLLVLLLSFAFTPGAASDIVEVDLEDTLGPATRIASGFLGAWKDALPDSFWMPLKPRFIRDHFGPLIVGDSGDAPDSLNAMAVANGDTAIWIQVVATPWSDKPNCNWQLPDSSRIPLYPGCLDCPWACWETRVDSLTNVIDSVRVLFPNIVFQYDIWNEPDGDFYEGDTTQFYALWDSTYRMIKVNDPLAVITGPSYSGLYLDAPGDTSRPFTMRGFLEHCAHEGTCPEILGWHSFDKEWIPLWNDNNMLADIDSVQGVLDSLEVAGFELPIIGFEINEMFKGYWAADSVHQYLQPGSMVRHFALAERALPLGLVLAARTFWNENWNGEVESIPGAWEEGYLNGLIDPHRAPPGGVQDPPDRLDRRDVWWTQKAYVDLGPTLVRVDSTGTIDGLAALNLADTSATVLLGSYRAPADSQEVVVRVQNLDAVPGLVINSVVEVTIERFRGGTQLPPDRGAAALPEVIEDQKRHLVDENGTEVTLTIPSFGKHDAVLITLRHIVPGQTIAPG